jgi:hypothetical protein
VGGGVRVQQQFVATFEYTHSRGSFGRGSAIPKNQGKKDHKFPARFAVRSKNGANTWKTAKLFVRFVKRSA